MDYGAIGTRLGGIQSELAVLGDELRQPSTRARTAQIGRRLGEIDREEKILAALIHEGEEYDDEFQRPSLTLMQGGAL